MTQGSRLTEADITEAWTVQPTAREEDVRLVLAFLMMVTGLDNVAAAEEIDAKEGTVRRWRDGDIRPLRKGTRTKLRRYTGATQPRPASGEEEAVAGSTPVVDPNTARRAMRAIPPEATKTRMAVIREYEDAYLEAGYRPDTWPQWFRELRNEVFGSNE